MANLKTITNYLQQEKLPYRIVDLKKAAFTVDDVVKSGIDPDEVAKTLIIRIQPRSRPGLGHDRTSFIALALRGSDRVDFKKVRAKFGSKAELAKPEEVLKVVGVPVGAVCPILVGISLYIDRKVMKLKNVHMGSGDLEHGLEMEQGNFIKALRDHRVEDFAV